MTHGKHMLRPHREGKTLTSSPRCVSMNPEREMPLLQTLAVHHKGGRGGLFPGEVPNTAAGPHSKLRESILGSGDHPMRSISLFGMRTPSTVSFW